MNESITSQKVKLEKRLAEAFPEVWPDLPALDKERALEEFHKIVWRRISPLETVTGVGNMGFNIGLLFIGFAAAIVLGLFVNVMDRWLQHFSPFYEAFVVVATLVSIFGLNRILESLVLEHYRANDFLRELLKNSTTDQSQSSEE